MTKITVVTDIPSPYQVDLLQSVYGVLDFDIDVFFCRRRDELRQWRTPQMKFPHCYFGDGQSFPWQSKKPDLLVISGYASAVTQRMMWHALSSRQPWAFWAERPGAVRRTPVGRVARIALQTPIRLARVPIWGIGAWAIEAYRDELPLQRLYLNVPYCSDLSHFLAIPRPEKSKARHPGARFLFAGSLIARKGVDKLAQAFVAFAQERKDATLTLVGSGPLEAKLREILAPIGERAVFLGFRQIDELPEIFSSADILCAPSRYDGWGLIVPEGLAAGLPVIAGRQMGAAHEMITDETGWIVEPDDFFSLLSSLRSAGGQDWAARSAMIKAGRRVALDFDASSGRRHFVDAVTASLAAYHAPST